MMSTQTVAKGMTVRKRTWKEYATVAVFIFLAAVTEYIIVLYAISLGVQDTPFLQWNFIAIGPLFQIVPLAMLILLTTCWMYLTRQISFKPSLETRKPKGDTKVKKSMVSLPATARSAAIVIILFSIFIALISLFAYPQSIYLAVTNTYRNNPGFLNFVQNTGATLSSVGSIFAPVNNALFGGSMAFAGFVTALGDGLSPLATLDSGLKYLAFQNIAAWISVLLVLLYGYNFRRGYYRFKKK